MKGFHQHRYLHLQRICTSTIGNNTANAQRWILQVYSLSLCINGHLPGEPGLASVYWSKGWWRWWRQLDYWSYKLCKAPVKSSPPTNHYSVFYRPDALPVAQPTVSKYRREISHSMDLITPSSPGVLQLTGILVRQKWWQCMEHCELASRPMQFHSCTTGIHCTYP